MYNVDLVFLFALLQKMRTKKSYVGGAVSGFDEMKAKNVLPFGQHSYKRALTRYKPQRI